MVIKTSSLHSAGHVFYHGALFIVWILRFELTFCVCIDSSMVLVYTLFPDSLLFCRPGWFQTLGSHFISACQILGLQAYATTLALGFFFFLNNFKNTLESWGSWCWEFLCWSFFRFMRFCFASFFRLCCFGVMVMLNSKFELGCICLFRGSFAESVP